jgi:heterotetrameric sarcosine oxidase gamma subunit
MVDRSDPLAALAVGSLNCPAVQLAALPPATRLIVHGEAAVASVGLTPPETCRARMQGGNALLWLGPDEFLLLAPEQLGPALPGAVDVSHRDAALLVSGPRGAWTINAFCALDLHPSAFPVGMCTRTLFGKAQIVLWRTDADTFRIEVARSLAPYVWGCLEEARREFLVVNTGAI